MTKKELAARARDLHNMQRDALHRLLLEYFKDKKGVNNEISFGFGMEIKINKETIIDSDENVIYLMP